jgi:hypothetical protein
MMSIPFSMGPDETPQCPIRPAQEPRLAKSAWLAHSGEFVRRRQRFEAQIRSVLPAENENFRVASQPYGVRGGDRLEIK